MDWPPIAIVGWHGVFPQSANPEAYWRLLRAGGCAARAVPPGRWPVSPESFLDPAGPALDRVYSLTGCFLDELPPLPRDVKLPESIDAASRLALAVGLRAWTSAQMDRVDRARVGVVLGNIVLPSEGASRLAEQIARGQSSGVTFGLEDRVAATPALLLASALGLEGGAMTLDAACASSLYAIKLAADRLATGEVDAMLAGGISRPDAFYTQMGFAQLRALSTRGQPRPLDAAADGLVVGEGAGVFILKRLDDALAAGDMIHAILRGAGLSNDVEGKLLAPSTEGQRRALLAAYDHAGMDPEKVDVFECHATGTPLGDQVELDSLGELLGQGSPPRIVGSAKSNVGHLLTAAGSAGLAKVLLAMQHGEVPPTANWQRPGPGLLRWPSLRVLAQVEPWHRRANHVPRRAALSAFGFGGINAHLLIEEYLPSTAITRKAVPVPDSSKRVAIRGIAARVGSAMLVGETLVQLLQSLEKSGIQPAIGTITIPHGRFRIPPREVEETLPQQLILLDTVRMALEDAEVLRDYDVPQHRTGVFVGLELDPAATDFHLRWKSLAEGSDREKIDIPPLTANRVVGSLGGMVASRVAREFRIGGPCFTISADEVSGSRALEVAVRMLRSGEIDRAIVASVDLTHDPRRGWHETIPEGAVALILEREGESQAGLSYAVFTPLDNEQTPRDELSLPVALAGAARSLLRVAAAAVSLAAHLEPESAAEQPARYWFTDRIDGPRQHVITDATPSGERAMHRLIESPQPRAISAAHLAWNRDRLLLIRGRDQTEIIQHCQQMLGSTAGEVARHDSVPDERTLALLPADPEQLRALIPLTIALVRGEVIDLPPWARDRIFFSQEPLGKRARIAFAYPGSGNHYPRMGRELATTFAELLEARHREQERLRRQFRPELAWTTSEAALADVGGRIVAQAALGTLVTDVLACCGVRPEFALGYSLGEATALLALGAWPERDALCRRIDASPLFREELGGRCRAARKVWGLAEDEPCAWITGLVNRGPDAVDAALLDLPRAYRLIVNTDTECIIGGEKGSVETLCQRLGAMFLPLADIATVHCELIRPVAREYRDLHALTTVSVPEVTFYRGATGEPYVPDRDSAADAILAQAEKGIHFPRLVRRVAEDGANVFLEIGPGTSLTRMIQANLAGRRIVARSALYSGTSERLSLLRLLGQLAAEGLPIVVPDELQGLWDEPIPPDQQEAGGVHLRVGGLPKMSQSPRPRPLTSISPAEETRLPAMQTPLANEPNAVDSGNRLRSELPFEVPKTLMGDSLLQAWTQAEFATTAAQRAYLSWADRSTTLLSEQIQQQNALLAQLLGQAIPSTSPPGNAGALPASPFDSLNHPVKEPIPSPLPMPVPTQLGREACLEYAIGSIAKVLGPRFAAIDDFPTRVRLPDEPLMLVDRIPAVEAEPLSMTSGRVRTEHDVLPGAWYLDGNRIPTAIAVESGQADLFLAGYLGIDLKTRGLAVYRLLDAVVTFHRSLPEPGTTIVYDIHIDHFFNQGSTILFRFWFDATIAGEPFLTMREGCAGFFTPQELAAGKGVVQTELDRRPMPGKRTGGWQPFVPLRQSTLDRAALDRLHAGDLVGCFGPEFARLGIQNPGTLPGGKLRFVDRIVRIEPDGGRFGLGRVLGEMDNQPDAWYLTCHFVDDQVMPGTLMYECCLHTLRIYLMGMGWVGEVNEMIAEPVPGVASKLKCRGQVIASTRTAGYEVSIKEIGYRPEPYAIADAILLADGKPIVEITNLSVRFPHLRRDRLELRWRGSQSVSATTPTPNLPTVSEPPAYDRDRILAFSTGNPSEAFGEPYRIFDRERVIARLPRPPFQFLDRIVKVEGEAWKMQAGTRAWAEYDVPPDAWYFADHGQPTMPFSILLEIALQPCGWIAAYIGSALTSDIDLSFRNLGGQATQFAVIRPDVGTIGVEAEITSVSSSGGMIIQHYRFAVFAKGTKLYEGTTYFGYFSKAALANQVGLREAVWYVPSPTELETNQPAKPIAWTCPPMPGGRLALLDALEIDLPQGGRSGLGYLRGTKRVDPADWFFDAHFYQDPVIPGSLGLESFQMLLRHFALRRWGPGGILLGNAIGVRHSWTYRGQVIPTDCEVVVEATITGIDDEKKQLFAEGLLGVDGRTIYEMKNFSMEWIAE